jgi:hypothetical protein
MSDLKPEGLHLLHVFPTFAAGGTQLRMAGIMNGMGSNVRHTVVSLNGRLEAAAAVQPRIPFETVPPPSGKGGFLYPLALRRIVKAAAPDLLLTYNWGAIDAVLGSSVAPLCPVIHNECGFGLEEASGMKARRVLMRRLALNRIYTRVWFPGAWLTIALGQLKPRPQKSRLDPYGRGCGEVSGPDAKPTGGAALAFPKRVVFRSAMWAACGRRRGLVTDQTKILVGTTRCSATIRTPGRVAGQPGGPTAVGRPGRAASTGSCPFPSTIPHPAVSCRC